MFKPLTGTVCISTCKCDEVLHLTINYVMNCLTPIKLCIDTVGLYQWFVLFHSSNTACCSYMFANIGQTCSIFPWSVQMQFYVWACRGKAVKKNYILMQHRCVNSSQLTRAQLTSTRTDMNINKHIYIRCTLACSSVMYYSKYVGFISWGLGGKHA